MRPGTNHADAACVHAVCLCPIRPILLHLGLLHHVEANARAYSILPDTVRVVTLECLVQSEAKVQGIPMVHQVPYDSAQTGLASAWRTLGNPRAFFWCVCWEVLSSAMADHGRGRASALVCCFGAAGPLLDSRYAQNPTALG